jgi:hypothetical protein
LLLLWLLHCVRAAVMSLARNIRQQQQLSGSRSGSKNDDSNDNEKQRKRRRNA